MDSFLVPLFFVIAILVFYPTLIIFVSLSAGLGVSTWLVVAVMLSPYFGLWYYVVKKRLLSELKLMMDNKPFKWNIQEAVEEYLKVLKKDEKKGNRD
jgi:hypothetical protein